MADISTKLGQVLAAINHLIHKINGIENTLKNLIKDFRMLRPS